MAAAWLELLGRLGGGRELSISAKLPLFSLSLCAARPPESPAASSSRSVAPRFDCHRPLRLALPDASPSPGVAVWGSIAIHSEQLMATLIMMIVVVEVVVVCSGGGLVDAVCWRAQVMLRCGVSSDAGPHLPTQPPTQPPTSALLTHPPTKQALQPPGRPPLHPTLNGKETVTDFTFCCIVGGYLNGAFFVLGDNCVRCPAEEVVRKEEREKAGRKKNTSRKRCKDYLRVYTYVS